MPGSGQAARRRRPATASRAISSRKAAGCTDRPAGRAWGRAAHHRGSRCLADIWTRSGKSVISRAMTKRPLMLAVAAAIFAAAPATAALQEGARVPSLITQGALAGKAFSFNLQQELRKGPV